VPTLDSVRRPKSVPTPSRFEVRRNGERETITGPGDSGKKDTHG
jgi:hypothetical protein